MKFKFFTKQIELNDIQSETLKVSILDAQKYLEAEREEIDNSKQEEIAFLYEKSQRIDDLIQKLSIEL